MFRNKGFLRTMANRLSVRFIISIICIIGVFLFVFSGIKNLLFSQTTIEFVLPPQYTSRYNTFDYISAMNSLNLAQVKDNDLRLINLIRTYYIENPSTIPYKLNKRDTKDSSEGQTAVIDKLLEGKEDGFFVDCGANDGETYSNSLFLERYRNWDGILIEASPSNYKELKKKNRKSFTLNACLNTKPHPSMATFLEDSWWGKIMEGEFSKYNRGIGGKGRYVKVQCFPLYSILLALNQTRVDYFSLDVEGAEKGVLNSIPWDKVDIKTMSVEYDKWPGGKLALIEYMKKRGYNSVFEVKTGAAADVIFVKQENV